MLGGTNIYSNFDSIILLEKPQNELCCACLQTRECIFVATIGSRTIYFCTDTCVSNYIKRKDQHARNMSGPAQQERERDSRLSTANKCAQCRSNIIEAKSAIWQGLYFCDEYCITRHLFERGKCCTYCNRLVDSDAIGKLSFKMGSKIRQFCSLNCVDQLRRVMMLCYYCHQDISNFPSIYRAPDENGQTSRDFCSSDCYSRCSRLRAKLPLLNVRDFCTVCNQQTDMKIHIRIRSGTYFLCGDVCFVTFKYAKNISTADQCKLCAMYYNDENENRTALVMNSVLETFCGEVCKNVYMRFKRIPCSCVNCKLRKFDIDMIRKNISSTEFAMVCSPMCLKQHLTSINSIGNVNSPLPKSKCNYCLNFGESPFYLQMPDSSVRYFCSSKCLSAFQGCVNNTYRNQNAAYGAQNSVYVNQNAVNQCSQMNNSTNTFQNQNFLNNCTQSCSNQNFLQTPTAPPLTNMANTTVSDIIGQVIQESLVLSKENIATTSIPSSNTVSRSELLEELIEMPASTNGSPGNGDCYQMSNNVSTNNGFQSYGDVGVRMEAQLVATKSPLQQQFRAQIPPPWNLPPTSSMSMRQGSAYPAVGYSATGQTGQTPSLNYVAPCEAASAPITTAGLVPGNAMVRNSHSENAQQTAIRVQGAGQSAVGTPTATSVLTCTQQAQVMVNVKNPPPMQPRTLPSYGNNMSPMVLENAPIPSVQCSVVPTDAQMYSQMPRSTGNYAVPPPLQESIANIGYVRECPDEPAQTRTTPDDSGVLRMSSAAGCNRMRNSAIETSSAGGGGGGGEETLVTASNVVGDCVSESQPPVPGSTRECEEPVSSSTECFVAEEDEEISSASKTVESPLAETDESASTVAADSQTLLSADEDSQTMCKTDEDPQTPLSDEQVSEMLMSDESLQQIWESMKKSFLPSSEVEVPNEAEVDSGREAETQEENERNEEEPVMETEQVAQQTTEMNDEEESPPGEEASISSTEERTPKSGTLLCDEDEAMMVEEHRFESGTMVRNEDVEATMLEDEARESETPVRNEDEHLSRIGSPMHENDEQITVLNTTTQPEQISRTETRTTCNEEETMVDEEIPEKEISARNDEEEANVLVEEQHSPKKEASLVVSSVEEDAQRETESEAEFPSAESQSPANTAGLQMPAEPQNGIVSEEDRRPLSKEKITAPLQTTTVEVNVEDQIQVTVDELLALVSHAESPTHNGDAFQFSEATVGRTETNKLSKMLDQGEREMVDVENVRERLETRQVQSISCQTDEYLKHPAVLPVPIPLYVPTPAPIFSAPYPVLVPFALPLPIPIILEKSISFASEVKDQIKKIFRHELSDSAKSDLLVLADMLKIEDLDTGDEVATIKPSPARIGVNVKTFESVRNPPASEIGEEVTTTDPGSPPAVGENVVMTVIDMLKIGDLDIGDEVATIKPSPPSIGVKVATSESRVLEPAVRKPSASDTGEEVAIIEPGSLPDVGEKVARTECVAPDVCKEAAQIEPPSARNFGEEVAMTVVDMLKIVDLNVGEEVTKIKPSPTSISVKVPTPECRALKFILSKPSASDIGEEVATTEPGLPSVREEAATTEPSTRDIGKEVAVSESSAPDIGEGTATAKPSASYIKIFVADKENNTLEPANKEISVTLDNCLIDLLPASSKQRDILVKEIVNPTNIDPKTVINPEIKPEPCVHPKLEPREDEPKAEIRPKIEPSELYPKTRRKRNINLNVKTKNKVFIMKSRIKEKICKTEVVESSEAVVGCTEECNTESNPPLMPKPRGRPRKQSPDETTSVVNGADVVVAKKQRELKRPSDENSVVNVGVPVVKKRMKSTKGTPVQVAKKRVRWKSVAFRTRSAYGKFCRKGKYNKEEYC